MTVYSTSLRLWEGTPGDPAIKNVWGTALNTNDNLIEAAILGTASVAIGGLTSYTLTTANGAPDQARPLFQSYTGALTANCTVTMPNVPKVGYAQNLTTGGFNVILTAGAGTTVTVPPDGRFYWFQVDGATNVTVPAVGYGGLTIADLSTSSVGSLTVSAINDISGVNIRLVGNGSTTPSKTIRVANGSLDVLNDAYTASILSLNDSGSLVVDSATINANLNVLGAQNISNNLVVGGAQNVGANLTVGGACSITGNCFAASFTPTSDERLKIDDGLIAADAARNIVMALLPRWFRWKQKPRATSEPGLFAQQVGRLFKWGAVAGVGAPGDDDFKPWGVNIEKFVPVMIAHMQSMQHEIDDLKRMRAG